METRVVNSSVGFFEEKPGHKSSARLFSFILLIFFCVFNTIYFTDGNPITWQFTGFDFMLLIGVFAPKYLQKLAEIKFQDNKPAP